MASRVSVKQTNPGWAKKIAERVTELANKEVAAGFPRGSSAGSETYDNGASVLDVAVWNQFGTDNPGGQPFFKKKDGEIVFVSRNHPKAARMAKTKPFKVPARPFMDEAVFYLEADPEGAGAYIAKEVIDGGITPDRALDLIGNLAVKAIQEAIDSPIMYEPNKPSTVKKKKSSKPLMNTNKLRGAVTFMKRDKT